MGCSVVHRTAIMWKTIKSLLGKGEKPKTDSSAINYDESYSMHELRRQYREEMAARITESLPVSTFEEWRNRKGTEDPVTVVVPVTRALNLRKAKSSQQETVRASQLVKLNAEESKQQNIQQPSRPNQTPVSPDRLARVKAAETVIKPENQATYPDDLTQFIRTPLSKPFTKGISFNLKNDS